MASRPRYKKPLNALKHGGYAALGLLPGENRAEFERLHKQVIEEFALRGPIEEDIGSTLARAFWRKKNLSIFRAAELANARRREIIDAEIANRHIPEPLNLNLDSSEELIIEHQEDREAREEARLAGEEQAAKELGELYELASCGLATDERLLADLTVEERLDGTIDKCIKRLLMVRGVKSMGVPARSEPAQIANNGKDPCSAEGLLHSIAPTHGVDVCAT